MVIYLNDYQAFFDDYGLRFCLDELARKLEGQQAHILIADGYDKIPAKVVEQYRDVGVLISDASELNRAIFAENPWLSKIEPLTEYLQICFVRHLILERYFASESTLSFDADLVWRYNPYELAKLWTGGSFVLDGSPCLTFAKDGEWFRAYREGLQRWCTDPSFGGEFVDASLGRTGVQHDQDLLQHLSATGQIEQDFRSIRAAPEAAQFCLFANPLAPVHGLPAKDRTNIKFSRQADKEYFNDRLVPFWHMQTGFSRYLAYFHISRMVIIGKYRIPAQDPNDLNNKLTMNMLKFLYYAILSGRFSDPKFPFVKDRIIRGNLYKEFFQTDLPYEIFNDETWWRPGLFAPRAELAA